MKNIFIIVCLLVASSLVAYFGSNYYFKILTANLEGCPLENKPVCAFDDYTYINECFMEKSGAVKRYDGECSEIRDALYAGEEDIKNDCICTMEYAPVCGLDGKTYGNACGAGCTDVEIAYQGECQQNVKNGLGLANPASTNCINIGGTLELKEEIGGQIGYCTLPDGKVCEEWALFRGECGI